MPLTPRGYGSSLQGIYGELYEKFHRNYIWHVFFVWTLQGHKQPWEAKQKTVKKSKCINNAQSQSFQLS